MLLVWQPREQAKCRGVYTYMYRYMYIYSRMTDPERSLEINWGVYSAKYPATFATTKLHHFHKVFYQGQKYFILDIMPVEMSQFIRIAMISLKVSLFYGCFFGGRSFDIVYRDHGKTTKITRVVVRETGSHRHHGCVIESP